MKLRKSLVLMLFAWLVAASAAGPAAATAPVTVQVTPNVSMAPATVRVVVTVEPDDRNRGLVLEADSQEFYSSSQVTLEGDRSSRVQRFTLKNLPPGTYEIRATIQRNDGDTQVANAQYLVTG